MMLLIRGIILLHHTAYTTHPTPHTLGHTPQTTRHLQGYLTHRRGALRVVQVAGGEGGRTFAPLLLLLHLSCCCLCTLLLPVHFARILTLSCVEECERWCDGVG